MEFSSAAEARQYILAHDNDVKKWNRQGKAALAKMLHGTWVVGGPSTWSKDELINRLAEAYHPHVQAARDVYYASAAS